MKIKERGRRLARRDIVAPPKRGPKPRGLVLGQEDRNKLLSTMQRRCEPASVVERARALMMLSEGACVSGIAKRLGRDESWVRRLRLRYEADGLEALKDRVRSGRAPIYSPELRCELIAMACGKPADYGIPARESWTYGSLRDAFVARHPEANVSRSWVVRTLLRGDLRPHRMQLWLHSPDPDFR